MGDLLLDVQVVVVEVDDTEVLPGVVGDLLHSQVVRVQVLLHGVVLATLNPCHQLASRVVGRFEGFESSSHDDAMQWLLGHGFGDLVCPFHRLGDSWCLLWSLGPSAVLLLDPSNDIGLVLAEMFHVLHQVVELVLHRFVDHLKVEHANVGPDVSQGNQVGLALVLDHSNTFILIKS